MQHLPPGVNLSVPDLGRLKKAELEKPLVAATVKPGDRVMVLLPSHTTQNDMNQISQALKQWAPDVEFLVLAGPESITVIPAAPVEDKAPQGHWARDCPGPPECV